MLTFEPIAGASPISNFSLTAVSIAGILGCEFLK
jgi:hypothetical protein